MDLDTLAIRFAEFLNTLARSDLSSADRRFLVLHALDLVDKALADRRITWNGQPARSLFPTPRFPVGAGRHPCPSVSDRVAPVAARHSR